MFTPSAGSWPGLISALALALAASSRGAGPESYTVIGLEKGFDAAHLEPVGPTTFEVVEAPTGKVLRVSALESAKQAGVRISAPNGAWDFSQQETFTLHLENPTAGYVEVVCKASNSTIDGNKGWNQTSSTIAPKAQGMDWLTLRRLKPDWVQVELAGIRGCPWGMDSQRRGPDDPRLDPTKIVNLTLYIPNATAGQAFDIADVVMCGAYYEQPSISPKLADPAQFFPFIDEFGQYIHRDWPGKTHSIEEMRSRVAEESKDLAARPGPDNWNKYGGYAAGPTLATTGFFRVQKYEGRWWLVDPEGKLFVSTGINDVGSDCPTYVTGREKWFKEVPSPPFVNSGRGGSFGDSLRPPRVVADFGGTNLQKKYGEQWQEKFRHLTHRRLRSWGINTIANWSDTTLCSQGKTAYVMTIPARVEGMRTPGSNQLNAIPDVYDAGFKGAIIQGLERISWTFEDPWCIGYFMDNELSWGDESISLAMTALACGARQPAKQAFIVELKGKYATIEALNDAWGASFASWDAMLESTDASWIAAKAVPDLEAFSVKTAEAYFRQIKEAITEQAQHHLYLGCRFAQQNPVVVKAAAKHCDVVSFNTYYRTSIDDYELTLKEDRPVMSTEFHFGALDRGLFHTGLTPVANQEARAEAYKSFVLSAVRHPQFVGTHWYEYRDECTTARTYDDENYQIGFIDVADTPYPETIAAAREVGQAMYPYGLSQQGTAPAR